MAGLNDNLAKAKKLLKEIETIYKSMGMVEINPFKGTDPETIARSEKEIKKLEVALDGVLSKAQDLEDGFGGITASIGASLAEMNKTDSATNRTVKAMRGIRSITSDLANDQSGLTRLSLKELKAKQDKLKSLSLEAQQQSSALREQYGLNKKGEKLTSSQLNMRLASLDLKEDEKAKISEILSGEEEGFTLLNDALQKTQERVKEEEKINKQLGVAGGLLKGISKIPILGDVFNASEALTAMRDNIDESKSSVSALGAGFKNIGKQITEGVLNPSNMILAAFTFIIDLMGSIDKQSGEYAKNMNVSYSEAVNVREEMSTIARESGDAALNAKRLLETSSAVGKALGTNAQINKGDLETMTKLVNQSGFQFNEVMNIQKLSLTNGKTLEQNTKEIFGGAKAYAARNKIVVNEKEVLKEVNNSSKALQLSLGSNTSAIAEAVVKAKQFGINLEQAESIAKGLLDFESSISAELEAELLTGKDLNFEKARQLSLEGNIAGAAAEVLKQVKSSAEFGAMNVIQQEAMAKAAGLNREQLAASLIEREALNKIGMKDAEEARKKYDLLRLTMTAEQAAAKLGDEELAKQYEQQSNAEKFQQAVEKIKDIFASIVDGPLGTMLDLISKILSSSTAIYGITGLIAGVYAGKMVAGIASTITKIIAMFTANAANAVAATTAATAISFGTIIPVILGAVAAIGGAIYGYMKDGEIDPKEGPIISGEFGSVQLDPADKAMYGADGKIKVGTNLMGDKQTQHPTQTTQASVDMTQTNALLNKIAILLSQPSVLTLDNNKLGEATKMASFIVE